MYERILVPLDGSARAERAIHVAVRIARALGSSVILMRVATAPVDTGKYSSASGYVEEAVDSDLSGATSYLKQIAESNGMAGINTEVKTFTGAVAPAILSAAQSFHASLIVMCSHGFTGFRRWALGSVADKITRHSSIPVLVLREGGSEPATQEHEPVRALVAVDGSPLSEAALEPAAYLAAALAEATSHQGALHLLRVVDLPTTGGKFKSDAHIDTGTKEQVKHEDEEYLDTLVHRISVGDLAHLNLAITRSVEADPDIAEAIVNKSEQDKFDFTAIATHGRGGVQKWALGSVAGRVLHATTLPLLIMRPQAIQASAGSDVK
jgi:nucleotide-binding universal stress UspA family protein